MTRGSFLKHALLATCALISLGLNAADAQVRVQSGEHPGHSRLVFQFSKLPEWNVTPGDRRHVLNFDPAPSAYLLDDVFHFIPRTRLAELTPDTQGSGIVLELNCLCRLEVYETRGQALVVDIHDSRDAEWDDIEWADFDDLSSLNPRFVMAHTPEEAPEAPSETKPPTLSPLPQMLGDTSLFPYPSLPNNDVLMQPSLTRALAEELARAASQGLVDADQNLQPSLNGSERGAGNETDEDADELMRLRTGLDQAFADGDTPTPGLSPFLSCPRAQDFDIANWGSPDAVHSQIAKSRANLIGEFDRVDESKVLTLARLYTYLTFDIETANLVSRMLPNSDSGVDLVAVARLIGSNVVNRRLARFGECDGALPLLAFLATPIDEVRRPQKRDAVLLTFSDLPPHLRRHLAEPLTERFAALGDDASVEVVLGSIDRISANSDPNVVMAKAKGSTGGVSTADSAALDELATSLKPEAAEALLINIRDRLARGQRIPQDLIDTAEILAIEQRGGAQGEDLKTAQIASLIANGSFAAGFSVLKEAEDKAWISDEQIASSWQLAFTSSLTQANDVTFSRLMFDSKYQAALEHLEVEDNFAIAERLLDLGFANLAEKMLTPIENSQTSMLAARLARSRGDFELALQIAEPKNTRQSKAFVAETLVASGNHSDAAAIFETLGDEQRRLQEAWRAAQWDLVATERNSPQGHAALAMLTMNENDDTQEFEIGAPSLATFGDLVDHSATLRETILNLFGEGTE